MPTADHRKGFAGIYRGIMIDRSKCRVLVLDTPKTEAPGKSVTVSFPALIMSLEKLVDNAHVSEITAPTHQAVAWSDTVPCLAKNVFYSRRESVVPSLTQYAVFALQPNTDTFGQVLWYESRHPDT